MISAVVIGTSFGGMDAIRLLLSKLSPGFKPPVIIVLHIGKNNINTYIQLLNNQSVLHIKEAEEKEVLKPGYAYFAPPNYHLLLENNLSFSLSTDEKVNFSRPSIDVLFETAAWTLKEKVLGILLTGSNSDGAEGLNTIKAYGGTTIVENPETARSGSMPEAALKLHQPDYVLNLEDIPAKLEELCR